MNSSFARMKYSSLLAKRRTDFKTCDGQVVCTEGECADSKPRGAPKADFLKMGCVSKRVLVSSKKILTLKYSTLTCDKSSTDNLKYLLRRCNSQNHCLNRDKLQPWIRISSRYRQNPRISCCSNTLLDVAQFSAKFVQHASATSPLRYKNSVLISRLGGFSWLSPGLLPTNQPTI